MALRINIPPLTRVLLVLLVGFSVVYQAASYRARKTSSSTARKVTWLTLTPRIYYYPWVLFTSTWAEHNLITLSIAVATIFYGGKYLERAWGSKELGKFLLVVVVVSNVCTLGIRIIDGLAIFEPIQGSIAIQAAFLVAFKQLVPEHTVTLLKGIAKVRVKHFPAIFLVANTISGIVLHTGIAAILCWFGFLTSWTYLRFYKTQPDLTSTSTGGKALRGDASETFAFAYFWPDAVHGPVSTISNAIYRLLVTMKILSPFTEEDVQLGNEQATSRGENALPSLMNPGGRQGGRGKREEAERRRALALKALDQRLQAASASRNQQPPSTPQVISIPAGVESPEQEASERHKEEDH